MCARGERAGWRGHARNYSRSRSCGWRGCRRRRLGYGGRRRLRRRSRALRWPWETFLSREDADAGEGDLGTGEEDRGRDLKALAETGNLVARQLALAGEDEGDGGFAAELGHEVALGEAVAIEQEAE